MSLQRTLLKLRTLLQRMHRLLTSRTPRRPRMPTRRLSNLPLRKDPEAEQKADAPEEPAAESKEDDAAAKANAIAAAPAAAPAAADADSVANTIIFKHIQNHDDSVSIGADGTVAGHGYNVMKYSIVLVNTDGTVTETLPQGSVVPDEYTFYNTTVDMSTAFTQMGLSIPGYTI